MLIKRLQEQLNLFYIALAFLTRIPVPSNVDYSQDKLNQASRYFSLVGWLVGLLCALVFYLVHLILPLIIAILSSMLFSILLTGCFHEDGLVDTCDGFGGAWDIDKKLSIMKDSRIGTYGATALWFTLAIKFALLSSLAEYSINIILLALIAAHPISRSMSTIMIYILPYVSDTETSKVKPLAKSQKPSDIAINLSLSLIALLCIYEIAFWLLIVLGIFIFLMKSFLYQQIRGFTGDTLGATQQIAELLIYATILSFYFSSWTLTIGSTI